MIAIVLSKIYTLYLITFLKSNTQNISLTNESYFNDLSFRFNFTKVSQKATIVSKNKEELSYILTDVPNDSLDVSTSLRKNTNYNLIKY